MKCNLYRFLSPLCIMLLFILFIGFINCGVKTAKSIDKSNFEKVAPSKAIGTSKICNSSFLTTESCTGNFLSRIWALYGPPDDVNFEGFTYTFKDKETGLIFTAYSAGSGPAYGGNPKDASKLKPIIQLFEELIKQTKPIDCQIEYDTDYGRFKSGAKNGIPFDEQIDE